MIPQRHRKPIWLIILGALVVRLVFAFQTPAWEAPDEYAHYWYIEQLVRTGSDPIATNTFPNYEAYQPSTYYWLGTVFYELSDSGGDYTTVPISPSGRLLILRLLSVAMGVLTVAAAYRIFLHIKKLTPETRLWATAFVAFLPTFVGMNASVNNDSMVVLLTAVTLMVALRGNWTMSDAFSCGLFAGFALLTKLNAAVLLPVIVLRLWYVSRDDKQGILRRLITLLLPWLICAGYLVARSLATYGTPLALSPGAETGFAVTLDNLWRATRNLTWSFWLAFGRYYALHPGALVYALTVLPLILAAVAGWLRLRRPDRRLLSMCLGAIILGAAASLVYTLSFPAGTATSWGKNLYPVLPLIALFFVVGWKELWPARKNIIPAVAVALLGAGCVWGIIRLSTLA